MNVALWIIAITGLIFLLTILAKIVFSLFKSKPNIAVVSVNGILQHDDDKQSLFKKTEALLDAVAQKENFKALILRVNSPGGTVGASQEIYESIVALRKRGTKVVVMMEDVAASGGLYIAMAADAIIAKPGTITGSIGVIIKGYDFSKIIETLGIGVNTVRSGKFKDILSPTRPMTPDEEKLLQDLIDETNEQFRKTISGCREIPFEKVCEFADGRVFNGSRALALGLIDDCGGFPVARAAAAELAGIPEGEEDIEEIELPLSFADRLGKSLEKMNPLGRSSVAREFAPRTRGLEGLPLWLMRGHDL